jgi:hypothetical protein
MNRSERIEEIDNFMNDKFTSGIRPQPIELRLWPSMIALTEGSDVHRAFGFSTTQYFPYDDRWSFFYCSELIADITSELTDHEFLDWLRYVRAHVSAHTKLETQDEDMVDTQVFTVLPEARDLVGKVHNLFFEFS